MRQREREREILNLWNSWSHVITILQKQLKKPYIYKSCNCVSTNNKSTARKKFCFLVKIWLVRHYHRLSCNSKAEAIQTPAYLDNGNREEFNAMAKSFLFLDNMKFGILLFFILGYETCMAKQYWEHILLSNFFFLCFYLYWSNNGEALWRSVSIRWYGKTSNCSSAFKAFAMCWKRIKKTSSS